MKRDNLERTPKIYLSEIIEFIDKIEKYTKGMSYDDFFKDTRTVDAEISSKIVTRGATFRFQ